MDVLTRTKLSAGEEMEVTVDFNGEFEAWRLVCCPGFKKCDYDRSIQFVSNLGRFQRNDGDIIDQTNWCLDRQGYQRITVNYDQRLAHCVVGYTFLGPPPNSDVDWTIDHISGCRTDNRVTNLRWADNFTQASNRGYKRVELLDDGEERILVKAPKQAKMIKNKPVYGVPTYLLFYNAFVSRDEDLETLLVEFSLKESSVVSYISRNYKSCDAETLRKRLHIDEEAITGAYELVALAQGLRKSDPNTKVDLNEDINSSLGQSCTSRSIARSLIPRLYRDLYGDNRDICGTKLIRE